MAIVEHLKEIQKKKTFLLAQKERQEKPKERGAEKEKNMPASCGLPFVFPLKNP